MHAHLDTAFNDELSMSKVRLSQVFLERKPLKAQGKEENECYNSEKQRTELEKGASEWEGLRALSMGMSWEYSLPGFNVFCPEVT